MYLTVDILSDVRFCDNVFIHSKEILL